eukprot:gene1953-5042_t
MNINRTIGNYAALCLTSLYSYAAFCALLFSINGKIFTTYNGNSELGDPNDDIGEAPISDDDVGEAPIYDDDNVQEETTGEPSPTKISTTQTVVSATKPFGECSISQVGLRFESNNLIQRVPNATQEDKCCNACKQFELCKGWSYNRETMACELYSLALEGAIPDGTNAFDWISSSFSRPSSAEYHCFDDQNCEQCRETTGTCIQCTNNFYLLAGMCVEDCWKYGYINFGDRLRNRKCVAPFTCSEPSCECPSSLFGNFCKRCMVDFGDESKCTRCAEDRYNVNGRCRVEVVCRGYRFEEFPDIYCNCVNEEYRQNCFRCIHRGGFDATEPNLRCVRCRNSLYMDRDANTCVTASECPIGTVPTNSGAFGRECLPPSVCRQSRHQAVLDRMDIRVACAETQNTFIKATVSMHAPVHYHMPILATRSTVSARLHLHALMRSQRWMDQSATALTYTASPANTLLATHQEMQHVWNVLMDLH